jgi:hypothetical protein
MDPEVGVEPPVQQRRQRRTGTEDHGDGRRGAFEDATEKKDVDMMVVVAVVAVKPGGWCTRGMEHCTVGKR